MESKIFGGLSVHDSDPFIRVLHRVILFGVKSLALLMTAVIIWGIGDVIWVLYERLLQPPVMLLQINDILAVFGAFLAVLIAIEIFLNITLYLKDECIHVRLVIATALMAIARKVIVLDFKNMSAEYVFATAAVVFAMGLTYWLIDTWPGMKKKPDCNSAGCDKDV